LNSVESVNTIQRISTPTFAAAFFRSECVGDGVYGFLPADAGKASARYSPYCMFGNVASHDCCGCCIGAGAGVENWFSKSKRSRQTKNGLPACGFMGLLGLNWFKH